MIKKGRTSMEAGKFIKVLLTLTLIIVFSSCGLFKKTTKRDNHQIRKETLETVDSSTQSISGKEVISERGLDINTVTTRTETTTKKTTKGKQAEVRFNASDVKSGDVTLTDKEGRQIMVLLDSLSGIMTIKVDGDTVVEETTKRETRTEQTDRTKEKRKETDSTLINSKAIIYREDSEEESKEHTKEATPSFFSMIGGAVGILIVIYIISKTVIKK